MLSDEDWSAGELGEDKDDDDEESSSSSDEVSPDASDLEVGFLLKDPHFGTNFSQLSHESRC